MPLDKELFVQNIEKICVAKGVKPIVACREEVPIGAYSKTQLPAPVDNGRSVAEQAMLTSFCQLNEDGQLRTVEYMGDLLASGRYSSEGSGKKPA